MLCCALLLLCCMLCMRVCCVSCVCASLTGGTPEEGAGEFHHFLGLLGDRVALKGWAAYAANLNTTDNSHGSHSIYTRMGNFEVMFHVAPLIAYTSDKQVLTVSVCVCVCCALCVEQSCACWPHTQHACS